MTVRELIDTNWFIVEAVITIRGDYEKSYITNEREFKESLFVHEFRIGSCVTIRAKEKDVYAKFGHGERGQKFKDSYTTIQKGLNVRETSSNWATKITAIPKNIQDLEVTMWRTSSAYDWSKMFVDSFSSSAQKIEIECYIPENEVTEIRIETTNGNVYEKQLEGQINILDIIGE